MRSHEYATVLAAWLRLPKPLVDAALAAARRAGAMPGLRGRVGPDEAAAGLVGVMVASLGAGPGLADRVASACAMSLEAPPKVDPLDVMPREAFCRMVGKTAGALSANGYLTLAETLGTAFARHEENLGTVDLDRIVMRLHGSSAVACVCAASPSGPCAWTFTREGAVAPRAGLLREVSVGAGTLSGIAFVLSADAARG